MSGLVLLLVLSTPAAAETLTRVIGPIELRGPSRAMLGPEKEETLRFEKPAFITALSVRVLDAEGRSRNHEGLNCHSLFNRTDLDTADAGKNGRKLGLSVERDRFGLSDNQPEIRFPPGFGVRVGPERPYRLFGMLQNPRGAHDGVYRLEYTFELAPADAPVKELMGMLVKIQRGAGASRSAHDCGPESLWFVPPGRHVYKRPFGMPYDARLHFVSTHVHAHAEELALVDLRTGQDLLRATVRSNATGELEASPVYSSAEGVPLEKAGRYEFQIAYRNPGQEAVDAMGNLRLFVHPEAASR